MIRFIMAVESGHSALLCEEEYNNWELLPKEKRKKYLSDIEDAKAKAFIDNLKRSGEWVQLKADKQRQPHICPVCNGTGKVPNGFYTQISGHWNTTSIEPEVCGSCNGKGVLWG